MVRLADLPKWEQEHLLIKCGPPLGPTAWVHNSKPLADKRIALITTAGLYVRGEESFAWGDSTYRALPGDEDAGNYVMGQSSANFDRSGFQADVNVVFPLDRFNELVSEKTLGSLASFHYSFVGAGLLPQQYESSVRSLAAILKRDRVDAVFITPVCSNCTQSACAIAYYLESEGIMTITIGLVREIGVSMQPPRMLWTSFPLGHPLGKPNDAQFQHRVIRHALDLLERPEPPVLEDFPLDVPYVDVIDVPPCSITFAKPKMDATTFQAKLQNELLSLRPWYDLSKRNRGRTTVGHSDSSIEEILTGMARWLDNPDGPFVDLEWFRLAILDAKAFYSEALMAQPGDIEVRQVEAQMWNETVLGKVLKTYYQHFEKDARLAAVCTAIAPRQAIFTSTHEWEPGFAEETLRRRGQLESKPGE